MQALLKTMDKHVMAWHRTTNGGIFHAYKTAASPLDPADLTKSEIKFDGVQYMPDRPASVRARSRSGVSSAT